MTGLGLSEMKTVVDSELAVAHLVFKVADLQSSCQFYSNLGLPPFAIEEKVAIIELRGGTHLLLLSVDEQAGEDIAESVTGQFHCCGACDRQGYIDQPEFLYHGE
jgi:catechol-2,3-dioxygenase